MIFACLKSTPGVNLYTTRHGKVYIVLQYCIIVEEQKCKVMKMNKSEYRKKRKEIRKQLENNSPGFRKLSTQGQYNAVTEAMKSLGYTKDKEV